MSVAFTIDRSEASLWYYKTHAPTGVYGTADMLNTVQEELYKFARDNGFRARRYYNDKGKRPGSYWKLEEHEFNLLRLIYGNVFKPIKVSSDGWHGMNQFDEIL